MSMAALDFSLWKLLVWKISVTIMGLRVGVTAANPELPDNLNEMFCSYVLYFLFGMFYVITGNSNVSSHVQYKMAIVRVLFWQLNWISSPWKLIFCKLKLTFFFFKPIKWKMFYVTILSVSYKSKHTC